MVLCFYWCFSCFNQFVLHLSPMYTIPCPVEPTLQPLTIPHVHSSHVFFHFSWLLPFFVFVHLVFCKHPHVCAVLLLPICHSGPCPPMHPTSRSTVPFCLLSIHTHPTSSLSRKVKSGSRFATDTPEGQDERARCCISGEFSTTCQVFCDSKRRDLLFTFCSDLCIKFDPCHLCCDVFFTC